MQSLVKNDRKVTDSILVTKTITCDANNTSVIEDLFQVTGHVLVKKLYGVVTATLGSSHSSASIGLRDTGGGAQGLTGDFTLNDYGVGSIFAKTDVNGGASNYTKDGGDDIAVVETSAAQAFQEFIIATKQGSTNYIGYSYTTTNTPTQGEFQFFCEYVPLSEGATVTAV